jgi:hypothetical protein
MASIIWRRGVTDPIAMVTILTGCLNCYHGNHSDWNSPSHAEICISVTNWLVHVYVPSCSLARDSQWKPKNRLEICCVLSSDSNGGRVVAATEGNEPTYIYKSLLTQNLALLIA